MDNAMQEDLNELKSDVLDLKFKVRDLDFHYDRLDAEVQEIKKTLEETTVEMKNIVKEASTNVPKWLMAVFTSTFLVMGLATVGWVISAIIFKY